MGFLDKLFGRAKETAGDAADVASPVVEKAEDAVSDVTHGDDAPSASGETTSQPGTTGSTPPAAS